MPLLASAESPETSLSWGQGARTVFITSISRLSVYLLSWERFPLSVHVAATSICPPEHLVWWISVHVYIYIYNVCVCFCLIHSSSNVWELGCHQSMFHYKQPSLLKVSANCLWVNTRMATTCMSCACRISYGLLSLPHNAPVIFIWTPLCLHLQHQPICCTLWAVVHSRPQYPHFESCDRKCAILVFLDWSTSVQIF